MLGILCCIFSVIQINVSEMLSLKKCSSSGQDPITKSNFKIYLLLLTLAQMHPSPDQRHYANPVTEDRKLR